MIRKYYNILRDWWNRESIRQRELEMAHEFRMKSYRPREVEYEYYIWR